ncbi:MAG: hypothetical protein II290_09055 [Oscillospiraceae bacterium]|nr:hypothetical protein [Oscillospiraceae bacterium]
MAMHFGRRSDGGPKSVKWVLIAVGILLGLLLLVGVLVFVFYWCVHPLITYYMVPAENEHSGISHFEDRSYLEYEGGERFEEVLGASGYLSYGTVVDFYHMDNRVRDNPIYGKFVDVFAVDIQLESDNYSQCRDEIVDDVAYCCEVFDYELYLYHADPEKNDAFLVAFCDEKQVLRCVLFTDMDDRWEFKLIDYGRSLNRSAVLDWFGSDDPS